jgi:amino acid adenylation domain-containing protein
MKQANVHEWFSQTAEQFPTRTAIDHHGSRVSYEELEASTNRLANFLLFSGASKGSVVGLMVEDRAEFITAILATLKAGCAFVPFDPDTPQKRLEAMIVAAEPGWFLADASSLKKLDAAAATVTKIKAICLGGCEDEDFENLEVIHGLYIYKDTRPPSLEVGSDDLCYIYFTSGSTGRPKGVAGRLKAIDHFIRWEIETFSISHEVRCSQLVAPTFDAFLRDMFVPLCAGGVICVPPAPETTVDAEKLVEWIDGDRISLIHCVPSLFRAMLAGDLHADLFPSLRHVLLSGEPLLPSDVRRWANVFGDRVQLVNLYGPTETTMTKFFYLVTAADAERRAIPIGKPMPGARAIIVDQKGQPCAPGSFGEIYIRTPYRTHGYYKEPELTRDVFIPNPFTGDENDLVYKTGDLGRILSSGDFEFLGRRDGQVKVRGVRMELGEIEGLLRDHPTIRDVAVVSHEERDGSNSLCAYVVLSEPTDPSLLRAYLATSLPSYMLPSYFVELETLPRTLSGKVDRRALPKPEQARSEQSMPYIAPRTPVEEALVEIWRRVLGLKRIGIHDNFFVLGGHSLLATQLLSRIRGAFDVELHLRSLFDGPTVAEQAVAITQLQAEQDVEQMVGIPGEIKIGDGGRGGDSFPLSFAQRRLWFLDQFEPGSAAYNIPDAVRLIGPLDVAALEQSLGEIMRRHESLRTVFTLVDGEPRQVVRPNASPGLSIVDLGALSEDTKAETARRLAEMEARRSFALLRGPVMRATLLRSRAHEHILLLTMHHIVADAWSIGVFARELTTLYDSYCAGQPSPLENLPIQYVDFAQWQNEWLSGDTLAEVLSYWKSQLTGPLPILKLPTDRPRPSVQTFRGSRHGFVLSSQLSEALELLSRHEDCTLFMTLLAAFATLLHRYTDQGDLIIGTNIANRNRTELENLIGFFVNMLALRTNCSDNPSFRQLLRRVRDVTLSAYAHQDLPFDKLVEDLRPERTLTHTPIFQVVFSLQNAPNESVRTSLLKMEPLPVDQGTAKFDLVMNMWRTASGLKGSLEFNLDLFDPATITRMLRHFERLLGSVVDQPDARLDELEMLTEDEHALLAAETQVEELREGFRL